MEEARIEPYKDTKKDGKNLNSKITFTILLFLYNKIIQRKFND